jgi:hypothetical protein
MERERERERGGGKYSYTCNPTSASSQPTPWSPRLIDRQADDYHHLVG